MVFRCRRQRRTRAVSAVASNGIKSTADLSWRPHSRDDDASVVRCSIALGTSDDAMIRYSIIVVVFILVTATVNRFPFDLIGVCRASLPIPAYVVRSEDPRRRPER